MTRKPSRTVRSDIHPSLHDRLLSVFNGGDGFGMILYFWALASSLIGAVALVAIGAAFWSWWAMFLGLLALRCYAYLGRIGRDLLDRMMPYDG